MKLSKFFNNRKKRISFFVALIPMMIMVLVVQSASAYWQEIGVIDSKLNVSVDSMSDQGPSYVGLIADFKSWYKVLITNRYYEYRWITIGGGDTGTISCGLGGYILITFPNYVTISYVGLSLAWGAGTYTIQGGQGRSWVGIHVTGLAGWYVNVKTNNIPSSYWGSTIGIIISAQTGRTTVNSVGLLI